MLNDFSQKSNKLSTDDVCSTYHLGDYDGTNYLSDSSSSGKSEFDEEIIKYWPKPIKLNISRIVTIGSENDNLNNSTKTRAKSHGVIISDDYYLINSSSRIVNSSPISDESGDESESDVEYSIQYPKLTRPTTKKVGTKSNKTDKVLDNLEISRYPKTRPEIHRPTPISQDYLSNTKNQSPTPISQDYFSNTKNQPPTPISQDDFSSTKKNLSFKSSDGQTSNSKVSDRSSRGSECYNEYFEYCQELCGPNTGKNGSMRGEIAPVATTSIRKGTHSPNTLKNPKWPTAVSKRNEISQHERDMAFRPKKDFQADILNQRVAMKNAGTEIGAAQTKSAQRQSNSQQLLSHMQNTNTVHNRNQINGAYLVRLETQTTIGNWFQQNSRKNKSNDFYPTKKLRFWFELLIYFLCGFRDCNRN